MIGRVLGIGKGDGDYGLCVRSKMGMESSLGYD